LRYPIEAPAGLLLRTAQKHFDTAGSPCGYSASEEIGIFRPDRATDRQRGGQDRPVFRVPLAHPLPSLAFELAVNFASNQLYKTA